MNSVHSLVGRSWTHSVGTACRGCCGGRACFGDLRITDRTSGDHLPKAGSRQQSCVQLRKIHQQHVGGLHSAKYAIPIPHPMHARPDPNHTCRYDCRGPERRAGLIVVDEWPTVRPSGEDCVCSKPTGNDDASWNRRHGDVPPLFIGNLRPRAL